MILTSVTPDLSIVSKKYHNFISPALRRVFLDTREDNSRVVVENLNTENAALKERVTSLERNNDILTDQCNSMHGALARLSTDEETARLENYKATADAAKDKQNLNRLMAENDALKYRARIHDATFKLTLALLSLISLVSFFRFVFTKLYL